MTDLTTLTDDQLSARRAMLKLEINAEYLISPGREIERFNRLRVEHQAVLAEIWRRSVKSR